LAKTRSDIRSDVLTHLGDTANTIWSAAEINQYVQEGYDDLVRRSQALWKRSVDDATAQAAVDDTASTATATLPTDLLEIDRVTWDDEAIPPLRAEQLELIDPSYLTQEGDVFGWIWEGDGIRTIRKIRVPSATAANKFVVEYFRRGTALSTDAVNLEVADLYAKYVRWFAMWKALEREGDGQDYDLADHYRTRYLVGVERIKRRSLAARRRRMGIFGERSERRDGPPRPRLPWAYGEVVR